MKILLIGSGGREHAIARKISKNEKVSKIYCAPGNGGTAIENKCVNININSIEELKTFAINNKIDLTIVGPEKPLIDGIVDIFKKEGLKVFGPSQKAAMLEGSKSFSKDFMKKYTVKTAEHESFSDYKEALNYLRKKEFPIVIKADGLAAGKGVYICHNYDEGRNALKEIMIEDIFNGAGSIVVIEEYLEGVEASILSITDGKTIKPFISAKDHKQIYDGGKGPNTGGMGVLAPNPYVTKEVMEDFEENIMKKTLEGIKEENLDFCGIIFFGIMITKKGCYLLEYNVRMGDPETQSVLELMDSDLLELVEYSLKGSLNLFDLRWKNKSCCNIVLASEGYPGPFNKGEEIEFNKKMINNIIFAGSKLDGDKMITSGGRVLSVLGVGDSNKEAILDAYDKINFIEFKGKYFRHDIGM
ncbi:phosphoribosylamine--glycine ligase [Clostridium massiliamazoniense]|uniref:phosphoribosylamine--glycine ligase n=1 Tax=Clostridium massiliamazoniense TaxID=1347366 RepID=UPI0006D76B78|nr:phosphoribosylamine--glycine ligase [Clostridium massiliamazoniense]